MEVVEEQVQEVKPDSKEVKQDSLDNLGKESGEEVQSVVFNLGKEEYGVEIHEVERIIKMSEITRVPHAPEFVEGIINLRTTKMALRFEYSP